MQSCTQSIHKRHDDLGEDWAATEGDRATEPGTKTGTQQGRTGKGVNRTSD